jgi:C_GCAxxG_C_C family probable redox protein
MGEAATASDIRSLAQLAGERAQNLFVSRRLHCSEAVLMTLNRGLGGGLTDVQTLSLAAPFSEGIGNSGCLCGALSGALMAIGLLLGGASPFGRRGGVHAAASELLGRFKLRFGSTCCRVLSRTARNAGQPHFEHCAELTAEAARQAAELILERRPELASGADREFLGGRDSLLGGWVKAAALRMGRRAG